jgi:predicted metal-dependent phosphotriesterase family hydrolase
VTTARSGTIQTVTGPIAADELGVTLAHEHVYIQLWEVPGRFDGTSQLEDDDVLCEEVLAFKQRGGQAMIELTLPGIGRQPERLRRLSERTGVKFVMGCGWYRGAYYLPEDLIDRRTVDQLAEQLTGEITDGVGPNRIRPGIIGEIGVEKSWISAQEERVHRAAARAHKATGLAINTHSLRSEVGLAQLALFEEEGVDPNRVVIGHCDSYPMLDFWLAVVERGAYVALDNIRSGPPHPEERLVRLVLEMLERGYQERLLFSHDVCKTQQLAYFGGDGYTYLFDTFLPRLRERGVPEQTIRTIVVDNPRRVLTS